MEKNGHANTRSDKVNQEKCSICYTTNANTTVAPCGHTNFCWVCINKWTERVSKCPLCRMEVAKITRIDGFWKDVVFADEQATDTDSDEEGEDSEDDEPHSEGEYERNLLLEFYHNEHSNAEYRQLQHMANHARRRQERTMREQIDESARGDERDSRGVGRGRSSTESTADEKMNTARRSGCDEKNESERDEVEGEVMNCERCHAASGVCRISCCGFRLCMLCSDVTFRCLRCRSRVKTEDIEHTLLGEGYSFVQHFDDCAQ